MADLKIAFSLFSGTTIYKLSIIERWEEVLSFGFGNWDELVIRFKCQRHKAVCRENGTCMYQRRMN